MEKNNFDIIILGAGPAGATCALALKQSGLRIAFLDKDTFPRDKICGDSVSSATKRILKSLDPNYEQQFISFERKSNIRKAKLYSPNFVPLHVQFRTTSHCIKRTDFDNLLYSMATEKHPSMTVYTGSLAKKIERTDSHVSVTTDKGDIFSAQLLIACDGAHSLASKTLTDFTIDRRHHSGAVRQYYENIKGLHSDTKEVYFLKGYLPGYFWIFPLSDNQANVGFGMLSATISERKIDLRKSLLSIIRDIPEISRRFIEASPLEEIKGFSLPLGSKKRMLSGDRFMLCGDAASLIDPFSGEGIAPAMESGIFAAQQAVRCFEQNQFSADVLKEYDRRVNKKFWKSFHYHYYLQIALSDRVWLINNLISVCNLPFLNRRLSKLFY